MLHGDPPQTPPISLHVLFTLLQHIDGAAQFEDAKGVVSHTNKSLHVAFWLLQVGRPSFSQQLASTPLVPQSEEGIVLAQFP